MRELGSDMAPLFWRVWLAAVALQFQPCSADYGADLHQHTTQRAAFWWHYPNVDVPSLLGVNAVLRDVGESATLDELCARTPVLPV